MIEVSYKKISGEDCKSLIPISWRDLTWSMFVELLGKEFKSEIERLSFVSGIDLNILENNPLFLSAVIDSCRFIWDTPIEDYAEYIDYKYKVAIKDLEWGKFESAKALIQSNQSNLWASGAEIVKLYLDIDINQKSCVDVIGLVGFFLHKSQSFSNDLKT